MSASTAGKAAASPEARRRLVLGEPNEDLPGKLMDLHMLVMPGGAERTAEEWRRLFAAGGFEPASIRPLIRSWQLIEGIPAEG